MRQTPNSGMSLSVISLWRSYEGFFKAAAKLGQIPVIEGTSEHLCRQKVLSPWPVCRHASPSASLLTPSGVSAGKAAIW